MGRGFSKSFPLNVLQHYYSAKSQEVFPRVFLSMFYSTTTQPRVRGFPKSFPLNVLSTTLYPSTYYMIYLPSPQFYIPPRTIRLSQYFYTPIYSKQPIHSNSRNKMKH